MKKVFKGRLILLKESISKQKFHFEFSKPYKAVYTLLSFADSPKAMRLNISRKRLRTRLP